MWVRDSQVNWRSESFLFVFNGMYNVILTFNMSTVSKPNLLGRSAKLDEKSSTTDQA